MVSFELKYEAEEGVETISLERGKVSLGRGSEADYRFADDGLSRLHATVYCEYGKVWIVDENSSNGTLVNGERVGGSGFALKTGDLIKIGHYTNIRVAEKTEAAVESNPKKPVQNAVTGGAAVSPSIVLPLALIGIALFVIVGSAGVIGYSVWSGGTGTEVATTNGSDTGFDDDPEITNGIDSNNTSVPTNTGNSNDAQPSGSPDSSPIISESPSGPIGPPLPTKPYSQMSEDEKKLYIKVKAEKVAALIGNKSSGEIPPAAVASIKVWVDGYSRRFRGARIDDCRNRSTFIKSDMQTVLERASKNVPFITRSFRSQAVDPQVGIYVAMIESEHCVCLQSGTGPLGMFQFTYATAKSFGLNVKSNGSPTNPDERCEPQPASLASAKYLKYLGGRIGTGPLSVPLAIASYNSGEGGLGKNLMTALTQNASEERSFWTLVANAESLSVQFKSENIKYVPKFFAAAIVGENPRDFGSNLQALSTYSR